MKEKKKLKTAVIFFKTENSGCLYEKHKHRCMLCGNTNDLTEVKKNAFFCRECIEEIKKI